MRTPAIDTESPADPPHQHRRRSLDDVKRVGAQIIATKGFKETSIRDIADALGITKSTIYHHVASKDELLFAIISGYQTHGTRMIDAARRAGPDPRDSLRVFIRELVRMNAADPVMATLLARELRSLKGAYLAEVLAFRDEYESFVRGLILSGQATGTIRKDVSPRLATIAVFSMANALHQWFKPAGPLTADEIAANFEAILLDGLAASRA